MSAMSSMWGPTLDSMTMTLDGVIREQYLPLARTMWRTPFELLGVQNDDINGRLEVTVRGNGVTRVIVFGWYEAREAGEFARLLDVRLREAFDAIDTVDRPYAAFVSA